MRSGFGSLALLLFSLLDSHVLIFRPRGSEVSEYPSNLSTTDSVFYGHLHNLCAGKVGFCQLYSTEGIRVDHVLVLIGNRVIVIMLPKDDRNHNIFTTPVQKKVLSTLLCLQYHYLQTPLKLRCFK